MTLDAIFAERRLLPQRPHNLQVWQPRAERRERATGLGALSYQSSGAEYSRLAFNARKTNHM